MSAIADRILAGDVRSVARLLRSIDDRSGTWVESLAALYPHTGRARVLGITGNPGAGKSTLTDQLITHYRALEQRVAVIAVDPTSPFSGGAILGDRIRMQRHALDEGVFIRSLATRGQLGGVSRSTADSVHVLDAWGADVVMIETVGVGQDELEVARIAHTTIVVMAPGMGDDIQAIKAGILEVADVFAVNKADRDGADSTVRDLEMMIAMGHELHHAIGAGSRHHGPQRVDREALEAAAGSEWLPPIVKTIASRGQGIDELCAAIEKHRLHLFGTPQGEERLHARLRDEVLSVFRAALVDAAVAALPDEIEQGIARVSRREADPYSVARELVAKYRA